MKFVLPEAGDGENPKEAEHLSHQTNTANVELSRFIFLIQVHFFRPASLHIGRVCNTPSVCCNTQIISIHVDLTWHKQLC